MAATEHRSPNTPFRAHNAKSQISSSSPAFATSIHPVLPSSSPSAPGHSETPPLAIASNPFPRPARSASVLPILLPPALLRRIAFLTFSKHNLSLTTPALQALATFIGTHCGSKWREEGLGELVLDEIARTWKKSEGNVIVDVKDGKLDQILKQLETCMSGGKIVGALRTKKGLSGQGSALEGLIRQRPDLDRNESQDSLGLSALDVEDRPEDESKDTKEGDIRSWLKVVGAFEMPRLTFNSDSKHFGKRRYDLMHQRLLRNEPFQTPSLARSKAAVEQGWKVTSIANLRGRHGTAHLLLGLLNVTPTGTLAVSDPSGTIRLELSQAVAIDEVETWLCPGMIVLVDGLYEEDYSQSSGSLGNVGGVGGTIGGRFLGFSIGAPRCETRATTLGLSDDLASHTANGAFGWVNFLGLGSERAVGSRMRRLEQRLLEHPQEQHDATGENKVVIVGEVHLDKAETLQALRSLFVHYTTERSAPSAFILLGSFISQAALASYGNNEASSITYKEHFDALAALLADFSQLLKSSTFVFVPGDNDPWQSAISAGAAVPLPRKGIPEMFTSRVKRVFAAANANVASKEGRVPGEAVWTSNPSRLTLFGPCLEMVLFRDNISSRLRRNSVVLKQQQDEDPPQAESASAVSTRPRDGANHSMDIDQQQQDLSSSPPQVDAAVPVPKIDSAQQAARRLTKTILDQGYLSPFPLPIRPVHWSYAQALSLYPLPSSLVLCDAEKKNRSSKAGAEPETVATTPSTRRGSIFSFRRKSDVLKPQDGKSSGAGDPDVVRPRISEDKDVTSDPQSARDQSPQKVQKQESGQDEPLPAAVAIKRKPRRPIQLNLPNSPTNSYRPSSVDPRGTAFALPVQIWTQIVDSLDPADAANLALSCKTIRHRVGAGPWLALNDEHNHVARTGFLLPMDENLPDHLFCFLCASYHFRLTPGDEALYPSYKENPVYRCPNPRDPILPKTRLAHNRILPFYLAQLTMRAQRFGPEYGIPLTALFRSWKNRDSDWSHRTRFHIHKGHLLVRATSTCFSRPDLTPSEMRLLLFARNDYLPYFSVCSHWQDGDLIKFAKCALTHIPPQAQSFTQQLRDRPRLPSQQLRKPSLMPIQCEDCKPLRRCPQCPSEYLIEIKLLEDKSDPIQRFKHAISVTRWSDLGDGISPASVEWAACNGKAEYNSFAAVNNATICSIFEAAVSRGGPTQRAMSLGYNKWSANDVY
ncbi:MAG: DNA-directed DNA polymerase epsilon, subunit B [Chrysothrix sp. TS-e1954]|nr:MAG: DNA-directed DNA polymerase epsilon, subunit B [Chrysothrix sp. TS-e1954]